MKNMIPVLLYKSGVKGVRGLHSMEMLLLLATVMWVLIRITLSKSFL